jgi:hypothetical protein
MTMSEKERSRPSQTEELHSACRAIHMISTQRTERSRFMESRLERSKSMLSSEMLMPRGMFTRALDQHASPELDFKLKQASFSTGIICLEWPKSNEITGARVGIEWCRETRTAYELTGRRERSIRGEAINELLRSITVNCVLYYMVGYFRFHLMLCDLRAPC